MNCLNFVNPGIRPALLQTFNKSVMRYAETIFGIVVKYVYHKLLCISLTCVFDKSYISLTGGLKIVNLVLQYTFKHPRISCTLSRLYDPHWGSAACTSPSFYARIKGSVTGLSYLAYVLEILILVNACIFFKLAAMYTAMKRVKQD